MLPGPWAELEYERFMFGAIPFASLDSHLQGSLSLTRKVPDVFMHFSGRCITLHSFTSPRAEYVPIMEVIPKLLKKIG